LTDGVILLDKPPGVSSFAALAEVKARLAIRRVGHAGTLDPFADGLLVALSGAFTRLAGFASAMDKEYVAAVAFGAGTDTLDREGAVTAEGPVPAREDLEAVLPGFCGEILQVPPAFSAVHVGGRRAYEAARRGEAVALAPRPVVIHSLRLLGFSGREAVLGVCCSRGTYIRSLARDIAEKLGTVSHLRRLRRTRIGGFRVEDAVTPALFDPAVHLLPAAQFFAAAPNLGSLVLKEPWVSRAEAGRPLTDLAFESPPQGDGTFGAFAPGGRLVAVASRGGGGWSYAAVFPSEGQA
jgi:tRNA pseudouridine55 synthase